MTAQLAPNTIFRSWDNLGLPLVGGKLNTYIAGTTTPQATYTDSTQGTPNTNPVILNFRGEAFVWLDPALTYKFVLTDALNNLIWTEDNIQGGFTPSSISASLIPTPTNTLTLGSASSSWANAYFGPSNAPVFDPVSGNIGYYARTAAEIAAGVTPTNFAYFAQPWLWVRREGCVQDGSIDDAAAFNRCLAVASTTNTALLIDGPCYLNSNITIPTNVQLVFVGNGKLKPGAGKTITLGQTPQAGLWQIFDYSAGGLIAFGALGRTTEVWGEWWGANGDGVTNLANDVAINAALTSIWNGANSFGGTVRLGAGLFFISSTIALQDYTSIRGLNDWTKIKAKSSGWAPSSVMITANNGTGPMFDSRLEYLTIDANNVANIQVVVQSNGWQQRCGIYFCELLGFTQFGMEYAHGYGGAAVVELVSTDFFPNDVNGSVGAFFTGDGTVGWTKLNVRNCAFASSGLGVNATIGLWIDSRFVCALEGVDVEVLQYGIVLGNAAVLTGAGLSGGGQTPTIAGNAIVRCLGTWTGPSPANVNVIGCQIGGWTNMLSDQNRAYACAALNPFDGQLVWPPNMWRPQGSCVVNGGATPALANNTSFGVCSKLAGATIAHTATGEQTLTLATSMDTSGDIVCKASSNDFSVPQIAVNVTGATTIQIFTRSPTGVAADSASFVLDVFHTT